jgi:hypothetical protein
VTIDGGDALSPPAGMTPQDGDGCAGVGEGRGHGAAEDTRSTDDHGGLPL